MSGLIDYIGKETEGQDCSVYYDKNGELLPWDLIPTWYVQFLSTSPPDAVTEIDAKREMKRRGYRA